MPLAPADYLPHLRRLVAEFERVLRTADHDAPVKTCGDWRLTDLAVHLGNVHRWATGMIITGESIKQDFDKVPDGDLADWYAESAAKLIEALEAADPADPTWHFGTSAKIKAFWFRRQTQEIAVHLYDAATSAGEELVLDPVIAADGVDEVLTEMLPRVTRWHTPPPLTASLTLRATDAGTSWHLPAVGEGEVPAVGEDAEPAATAEGTGQELLLMLWQRYPLAKVELGGDTAAATAFLSARMTP
ncbi:maleylpyruvate isomerase family mycothiol-dependent enzyme [Amycolatopsis sp. cg5]|uniref:maleylpyruvate isomerase family mycothiol-dependent enzyme n=1 Tax=Amycolatopsis sp. cg5 TaxID=3238802 RepID=UPI00352454AA